MTIPLVPASWHPTTLPLVTAPWNPGNVVQAENLIVILIDDPPRFPMEQSGHFGFDIAQATIDSNDLYCDLPFIQTLADEGVTFTEYRTTPVCSAGRASLQTGRYPFRHGVGSVVKEDRGDTLREFGDTGYSSPTVAEQLEAAGVSTSIVGKMHLSIPEGTAFTRDGVPTGSVGTGYNITSRLGYGDNRVWLRNLNQAGTSMGSAGDYYWHEKKINDAVVDEVGSVSNTTAADYATTVQVDEAITFLAAQTGKFFLYVPFSAAHGPFNRPPESLTSTASHRVLGAGDIERGWGNQMMMMEAIDTEIGRLLASMTAAVRAKTTVVVVGDNGIDQAVYSSGVNANSGPTPGHALSFGTKFDAMIATGDHLKSNVYCGGTRAPCIWSGLDVTSPGRKSDALIAGVDLYPTIMEFFGVANPAASDGISMTPILASAAVTQALHARTSSLSQYFVPNGSTQNIPGTKYSAEVHEIGYVARLSGYGGGNSADNGLFLLRRDATAISGGTGGSNQKSPVGMNTSDIASFTPQDAFVNAMKGGTDWAYVDSSSTNFSDSEPMGFTWTYDSDGYPVLGVGEGAYTKLYWDGGEEGFPSGNYLVTWDGDGTVIFGQGTAFGFCVTGTSVETVNSKTITVDSTNGSAGIYLRIDTSNAADPVTNIKVIQPGHASNTTTIFTSRFLARMDKFPILRMMNFGAVNRSPQVDWADRPLTTHFSYNTSIGVPVEVMMELAEETESDAWLCVPHMATDAYITSMAQLVLSLQPSSRRVYWEYSNECWNPTFGFGVDGQYDYCLTQANIRALTGSDHDKRIKFHSERSVEMFDLLTAEFGVPDATVLYTRVMGSWVAGIYTTGLSQTHGNAYLKTDMVAVAPYIGSYGNTLGTEALTNAQIIANMNVDRLAMFNAAASSDNIADHVAVIEGNTNAEGNVVRLCCYEGGQTLVVTKNADGGPAWADEAALITRFHDINRMTEMETFYNDYIANWAVFEAAGSGPMCLYSFVTLYAEGASDAGSFGAMEYIDQPRSLAPKWAAIEDSIVGPAAGAAVDYLFQIADGVGTPVDPFELATPPGLAFGVGQQYRDQYLAMVAALEALLASSLGTGGTQQLPITGLDGLIDYIGLDEQDRIPITGIDGVTIQHILTSGGSVPIIGVDTLTDTIDLEDV